MPDYSLNMLKGHSVSSGPMAMQPLAAIVSNLGYSRILYLFWQKQHAVQCDWISHTSTFWANRIRWQSLTLKWGKEIVIGFRLEIQYLQGVIKTGSLIFPFSLLWVSCWQFIVKKSEVNFMGPGVVHSCKSGFICLMEVIVSGYQGQIR